jgi:hypothetical protein
MSQSIVAWGPIVLLWELAAELPTDGTACNVIPAELGGRDPEAQAAYTHSMQQQFHLRRYATVRT